MERVRSKIEEVISQDVCGIMKTNVKGKCQKHPEWEWSLGFFGWVGY